MNIEVISEDNINALTVLVLELWTDSTFEEEYENFSMLLNSKSEICYLAREQETYIAFIHISIRNDYVEGATKMPVAYIEAVYVKPDCQKRGIGKNLVNAAEKWALQNGCKQIASDTGLDNAAGINFHRHAGFTEANRIICFVKEL
jgi:aminoglycoside 6'-N-acetyltransferase I